MFKVYDQIITLNVMIYASQLQQSVPNCAMVPFHYCHEYLSCVSQHCLQLKKKVHLLITVVVYKFMLHTFFNVWINIISLLKNSNKLEEFPEWFICMLFYMSLNITNKWKLFPTPSTPAVIYLGWTLSMYSFHLRNI